MNKVYMLIVIFLFAGFSGYTGDLPVMRISVENTDSHTQTISVQAFVHRLQERTEGKLDVQFFSAASLARDNDAVRAMALGNIEMAVPGTWHIDSLVPEVGLFLLPAFYGTDAETVYQVLESRIGNEIIGLIEDDLFVKIPGRWIDLGHAHLFSSHRRIRSYQDIIGMRIRVAGGYANEARISALGGQPTTIAWADLPARLDQRVVGGVLTSYESVRSAALWNHGLSYVFEDRQYFAQYIPMISIKFWDTLTPGLQQIIIDTWEEGVDEARRHAAQSQEQARNILMQKGIVITVPGEGEIEAMQQNLLVHQSAIADSLSIPKKMVDDVMLLLSRL